MANRSLSMEKGQHLALFAALTSVVRNFATVASRANPELLHELDLRLAQGCIANFQFSIGAAGALGCTLSLTSPDGNAYEVVNIDAPSTDAAFSFIPHAETARSRA